MKKKFLKALADLLHFEGATIQAIDEDHFSSNNSIVITIDDEELIFDNTLTAEEIRKFLREEHQC